MLACLGLGTAASASAQPVVAGSPAQAVADIPAESAPAFTQDLSGHAAEAAGRAASAVASATPATATAAAVGTITQLPAGQECPVGTRRVSTQYTNGFESGTVPETTYTQGWTAITGQAHSGNYSARSTISSSDPSTQPSNPPYWRLGLPMMTVPKGKTVMRYSIKGNYPAESAFVSVNGASGWADQSANWGTVTLDISGAIMPEDNQGIDVRFANYPSTPSTSSQMDLDDIEIYTCSGSNVRGDYTGDGVADMLTLDNSGNLLVWPGTGWFTLGAPITSATGWTDVTAVISSGDLNGDGTADILVRKANGDLFVYYSDGKGGWSGSLQVGLGWNIIKDVIPVGDVSGDGLPDFLARDSNNNMRRYWLTGPGSVLTGGEFVGWGFGDFTSLFSMGDFNHDGRFDLTGILSNGDMRVYTTLPTGALTGGWKIGNGWGFKQVISPGDMNRDGNPDIIGLTGDGSLLSYPVLGDGRWGAIVNTGVGFGGFKVIG